MDKDFKYAVLAISSLFILVLFVAAFQNYLEFKKQCKEIELKIEEIRSMRLPSQEDATLPEKKNKWW